MVDDHDDAETHAVLLLPGWRHQRSGKLHIRRDCRAVQFYAQVMTPVLIRLDDQREVDRVFGGDERCRYCFPGGLGELPAEPSESE